MDLDLVKKTPLKEGFLAVEKISFLYTLLTSILILSLYGDMDHPLEMLLGRLLIVAITLLLVFISRKYPSKLLVFLRIAFQMGLLSYWYPDTYEFNRLFVNLDHLFASFEQSIFGFQPAFLFSETYPMAWLSEALHLGYFSYYPMIAVVTIAYFFVRFKEFDRVAFIIVGSFFLYYFLYIFIPVAGPQFYFPAIGWESAMEGVFPALGHHFYELPELLAGPGYEDGLFYNLVKSSQEAGERPTAAFPSSHVGISTILLFLSYRLNKKLMLGLLPFYILLCGATVYIQAHYVIDVFGGLLSALIIYLIVVWAYHKFFSKSNLL